MRRLFAPLCVVAIAAITPLRGADDLTADLQARRARLMDILGDRSIFVQFSALPRVYSRDIAYEYRQDSNLYYLTGIAQEQTILVLLPGSRSRRAVLFVRPRDPDQEHWDGPRLSLDGAAARSGIADVYPTTEFEPFIEALIGGPGAERWPGLSGAFDDALASGRARVSLVVEALASPDAAVDTTRAFVRSAAARAGLAVHDASAALAELRRIKSPYEQQLLRRSAAIASDGHLAGMRAVVSGRYEYEVEAAIEGTFLALGGLGPAYPSIVGSGPNATILHYAASRRRLQPGELLLIDAGVSYAYMASDITRTVPVDGRFSAVQREIYRAVLQAQSAAIDRASEPGASLAVLDRTVVETLAAALLRLGLITDPDSEQYRLWFTHGASHYVGLDVHDVGDAEAPLVPGVAFTVEPGLYIRPDVLDRLPATVGDPLEFTAAVRPAVERYRGIGVRIEDAFLMTDSGLEQLSRAVPRTVAAVEAFLARPASADR